MFDYLGTVLALIFGLSFYVLLIALLVSLIRYFWKKGN